MAMADDPVPVQAESQTDSPEVRRYNRIRRWLGVSDSIVGFVFLVVLVATGWSAWLRDRALNMGFGNYTFSLSIYVLLLIAIRKFLAIGFDYYDFRLEHNFDLSTQRFRSWAWDEIKEFLVEFVIGAIVTQVIYLTIRNSPEHWWVWSWVLFIGLAVVFIQLVPVILFPIFYKFEPLDNEDLRRRLVVLSERAGTRVRGVYRWKLSEKSKKANAVLAGLGKTRRIILADTLIDNYTPDEIEVVLAHELGHHKHRHMLKSIGVQCAITLLGFWAAHRALDYTADMNVFRLPDFANLPLLALVSVVLSFVLMPALNAYSRFNERQADRYAFESTASVEPFISSMNKLAEQNLAERTPSKWVEWFFHSHPSISHRLAAAEEWGRRQEAHPRA
jgi:Zn-dependent protease with chaperone function